MVTNLQENYDASPFDGLLAQQCGPSEIVYDDPTKRSRQALGKAKIMKVLEVVSTFNGCEVLRVHAWFPKTSEDKEVLVLALPSEEEMNQLSGPNWEFIERRFRQLIHLRDSLEIRSRGTDGVLQFLSKQSAEIAALEALKKSVEVAIEHRKKYI